jgi:hypothetical protein
MVGVLARHIYALTSHKNIAAVDYIFMLSPRISITGSGAVTAVVAAGGTHNILTVL